MKNFKTIVLSNQEISPGILPDADSGPGVRGGGPSRGSSSCFGCSLPAASAAAALRDFSNRISAPPLRGAAAQGISRNPLQGRRAAAPAS